MADRDKQQERFRQALQDKQEEASTKAHEEQLVSDDRPPDELSTRAKSTGHGKKTADKWNQ